jgi:hypothetical protein
MNTWLTLLAYQLTWFTAVIGAAHGWWWPGVAAAAVFLVWRLVVSRRRKMELRLVLVALALGLVLENLWVGVGLLTYRAAGPWPGAPAWILALWCAFALSLVPWFGRLHRHPWLAALLGAAAAPIAYAGAARGFDVVRFVEPSWQGLLGVAAGWALSVPLLVALAGCDPRAKSSLGNRMAWLCRVGSFPPDWKRSVPR